MPRTETIDVGESLTSSLSFGTLISLSVVPKDIKKQWKRCGITANFLASSAIGNTKSTTVVSTIVNEILENAIKYSENDSIPVKIELGASSDILKCKITNWTSNAQASVVENYFSHLKSQDIHDLYYTQLEHAALDASNASQIGLIGVLHDYLLGMNCKIDYPENNSDLSQISITAKINLNEEQ